VIVMGIQTDAAGCGDFVPRLFFELGVVNCFALCLRQRLRVTSTAAVKPLEAVPGATDGGCGRVVLAMVSGVTRTVTSLRRRR
jgi:hypothetical protein